MTPEQTKTLKGMIHEYGNSLARIQAEKELMKFIEQRALVELQRDPKAFKTVATAYWRDETKKAREAIEAQLDLFDLVGGSDVVLLRQVEL